jgi:hypothetical protein
MFVYQRFVGGELNAVAPLSLGKPALALVWELGGPQNRSRRHGEGRNLDPVWTRNPIILSQYQLRHPGLTSPFSTSQKIHFSSIKVTDKTASYSENNKKITNTNFDQDDLIF